jgi:hypothetical protein
MGNIPLPALSIKPPEQQDQLSQFANLMAIKQRQQQMQQQQALAPLVLEQQKQATQEQSISTQKAQQDQKDQMAFRTAMASPELQGKTIGEIADVLAQSGNISKDSWQAAKKADIEHRKSLAEADNKTLENMKAAHDQTQQLYNNVMNMPDDQLQANWPAIAQQYNSIPGNEKMPMDPNKPLPKQALAQFGPMISMGNSYFDQELARREKQAELTKTQNEAAMGGSSDTARFTFNYLRANNLPDTPANRLKAQKEYIKETKIDPAMARTSVFLQMPTEVADPNNPGETINVSRKDAVGMKGKGSASVQTAKGEAKYMTSGKGGQQLTAFNTAMTHLDTLDRLAGDLNNTDLQIANKAKQAWAEQTGNPAPANFAAAVNAMSGEVAAALKASGATDQEIAHVGATFSRAQSPAQLKGAINTYRELLKGKAGQLKRQYDSGMQGKPAFQDSTSNDPFAQFGGKAH